MAISPRMSPARFIAHVLSGRAGSLREAERASIDWDAVLTLAREERIAPLLYHQLTEAGWPAQAPDFFRRQLQDAYHAAIARQLLFEKELRRVAQALTALPGRPPILLLKGAALAATLYPDPALRPLTDLDLLLPRHALDAAAEALRALGYQEAFPSLAPGADHEMHHHLHLHGGPRARIAVELHWSLIAGAADWRAPSLTWFWEQTEPFPPYPELRMLTPTAHLLYLSAHLMLQHGAAQARLLWFYDLHLLLTQEAERLDWEALLARARAYRWAPALRAALMEVHARFGTPLPPGVLDTLAHHEDPRALRFVRRRASPLQTRATATLDKIRALNWSARLRWTWRLLCPSSAYMRWRYAPHPEWLWPVYYPYRWLDMLWEGGRTLYRAIRAQIRRG